MRQNLLGSCLMQSEAERERVRRMARDPEKLADCGNVRLAVRTVEAFSNVEDEVGTEQRETRGEAGVGLEAIDLANRAQGSLHRIDGGGLIPFGIQVGLLEV